MKACVVLNEIALRPAGDPAALCARSLGTRAAAVGHTVVAPLETVALLGPSSAPAPSEAPGVPAVGEPRGPGDQIPPGRNPQSCDRAQQLVTTPLTSGTARARPGGCSGDGDEGTGRGLTMATLQSRSRSSVGQRGAHSTTVLPREVRRCTEAAGVRIDA